MQMCKNRDMRIYIYTSSICSICFLRPTRIYLYLYLYIYICLCLCLYLHLHLYLYLYLYLYLNLYLYLYLYILVYAFTCAVSPSKYRTSSYSHLLQPVWLWGKRVQGDDQRRPVVTTAAARAVASFRYRAMDGTFRAGRVQRNHH